MKKLKLALCSAAIVACFGARAIFAQTDSMPKPVAPLAKPTPRLSVTLAENLNRQSDVSRQQREQAFVKLLEGQRYISNASRRRSSTAAYIAATTLAKESFQKALELNPKLVEGYVALAELFLITPPQDIDEAIALSNLAVKIQPDNFGAHRILAFSYTVKSNLNSPAAPFDFAVAQKAVAEWKEVARLDQRFAEAWAFLSALYDRTNKTDERIEALKRWQASATPVDTRYYLSIMGAQESLAPESVPLKLGAALIKANRSGEAVEVLSLAIADDAENAEAIDLLKQAVESGDGKISPATVQALQQAVFANPNNVALIELNADVQARAGRIDDAAKFLRSAIANLLKTDKISAASLQISLGDVYAGANRTGEAVAEYEQALKIQGIGSDEINTEEDREFATQVFGKIIQVYKNAGKPNEAKATIERARRLLGKDDLFADKQNISLLRETGKKQEALQSIRNLRVRLKDDYSLTRLEASVLTDLGRVDEGVRLIKTLLTKPAEKSNGRKSNNFQTSKTPPSVYYDDFTNYIFISSLYNQAKRGGEAVEAARQALAVAGSEEKKQIADLSLATAQQTAGNYQSAEETLRNLLKKSPDNPVALNNLGYFLLERNEKFDEALALIKQAVGIDPSNASYLDSLGWAYFKLGKLDEAETYLKEAVRNDSASSTVYEHLGDVYQKRGKFDLAKMTWQRAINISSDAEAENRLKEKLSNQAAR
ncbi:MAG: tetratricopeptide repeat protein [Pyrinomonadaceae bacterium]